MFVVVLRINVSNLDKHTPQAQIHTPIGTCMINDTITRIKTESKRMTRKKSRAKKKERKKNH